MADSTPAQSQQLNEIKGTINTGAVADLAPGLVAFPEAIVISHVDGGGIRGAGGSHFKGGWVNGQKATTIQRHATAGAAIIIDGSVNNPIRDCVIDGNGGVGVLIKSHVGWGTTRQKFEDVTFINCSTAIQCGEAQNDINCADNSYNRVTFIDCGVCFQARNDQSVNHHFRSIIARNVGIVFDPMRGGNITAHGADIGAFDSFLRVGMGGWNTTPMLQARAVRFEMNGKTHRHASLVTLGDKVDLADVIFEACSEAQGVIVDEKKDNNLDPVIRVTRGMAVKLRDHIHSHRFPFVDIDGGAFYDFEGRWLHYRPGDAGKYKRRGGSVRVENPVDGFGNKLTGVNK